MDKLLVKTRTTFLVKNQPLLRICARQTQKLAQWGCSFLKWGLDPLRPPPFSFILCLKSHPCDGLELILQTTIFHVVSGLVPTSITYWYRFSSLTSLFLLILSIFCFSLPSASFCAQNATFAKAWTSESTSQHYISHSFLLVPIYITH